MFYLSTHFYFCCACIIFLLRFVQLKFVQLFYVSKYYRKTHMLTCTAEKCRNDCCVYWSKCGTGIFWWGWCFLTCQKHKKKKIMLLYVKKKSTVGLFCHFYFYFCFQHVTWRQHVLNSFSSFSHISKAISKKLSLSSCDVLKEQIKTESTEESTLLTALSS